MKKKPTPKEAVSWLRSRVGRLCQSASKRQDAAWSDVRPARNKVQAHWEKFNLGRDSGGLPMLNPRPTTEDVKHNADLRRKARRLRAAADRWGHVYYALINAGTKLRKYPAGVLKNGKPLGLKFAYKAIDRYNALKAKEGAKKKKKRKKRKK